MISSESRWAATLQLMQAQHSQWKELDSTCIRICTSGLFHEEQAADRLLQLLAAADLRDACDGRQLEIVCNDDLEGFFIEPQEGIATVKVRSHVVLIGCMMFVLRRFLLHVFSE